MTRVLVTGGTGFVAGHVIDTLLKRGHSIVTTVRSEAKAQSVRNEFPSALQEKLDFAIVPDIAANDAFQGLGAYNLEAAIHIASPVGQWRLQVPLSRLTSLNKFHYNITDAKKDLIDPAVLGTTSVLNALHDTCPTVRRVALTSSFAAILDPKLSSMGATKTYTEADWSPLTMEDAYSNPGLAYAASKAFAEKAAWDFVADKRPKFSLTTICPPMVYGPVKYPVKSLNSVNTSNQLLAEIINGKHKDGLPPTQLPLWVDVRDVALAHVKAIETEEAADKRIFVTAGYYSNQELYEILYKNFPELRDRLPDDANKGGNPNPALDSFGYDTTRANTILGIEWIPYEKTIIDSAKSLL
ncbi:methylglyoxal reductase (NADPH-dependent) gre2 [Fusarium torreyae]|uniref:Methylglyoxal reductase (NADPH-dependent) gre2 n=1 Tax=Fusarium torreyae TaxID=1237075 RepID=A0A9W8RN72_9HYPO|nr:methylglyoxal reductase (NADPH-dependent) gre2 [Fusarium torreyae]